MLEFSTKQQRTVAAALTLLGAAFILCVVLFIAWLLTRFCIRFSGLLSPLAVAGVAALVFRPYYDWLFRRTKKEVPAVLLFFLSIGIPLTAILLFFGAAVVSQLIDLSSRLPTLVDQAASDMETRWPAISDFMAKYEMQARAQEFFMAQSDRIADGLRAVLSSASSAGGHVVGALTGLLGWVVFPVYMGFFLISRPLGKAKLDDFLPFLKERTRKDLVYLMTEFVNIIVAFFRGQLIVAAIQGLLFGIGFALVGLKYGFVLGLLLGFLNIMPYLGSIVGLSVALPLAYFQADGGLSTLIGSVIVFTIVQCLEGYVITPKIMGDRTGLHPIAIIVAILFWSSALEGMLGLLLAVPLTAFLVVFWRLAKEKYIVEIV